MHLLHRDGSGGGCGLGIAEALLDVLSNFVQVPEPKSIKNRLHLDLSPVDNSHAEEIDRALQLGATRVDVGQGEQPWEVLADPEGNEFCMLRSLAPDNPDRPDRA